VLEIADWYPASVREVASRWEQGLRGLLGLAGVSGLLGAPLAADRLSGPVQVAVGALLGVVVIAAGAGLVLTMSAAYGSVQLIPVPQTAAELQHVRRSLAERGRRRLVWGRRLAIGALALFGVAVTVAWLDPVGSEGSRLRVRTERGVTYCGRVLDAPDGVVAVGTESEGRVEIPSGDVVAVGVVDGCEGGQP
jgi:hypothetical protein